MKNNLTDKDIKTLNKFGKKYDIRVLKIKDRKEIFNIRNLDILDLDYEIEYIPTEVFKLIILEKLQIRCNNLIELPKEIGNLTNLKKLYISNYEIKYIPTEVFKLINLKILYISCKNLIELPKEIGNLTNLKELFIYCESLKELPKEIYNLINLKALEISCENLESFPDGIERLTNLEKLIIFGKSCNLKILPTEEIKKLNNIKELEIRLQLNE